MFYVHKLNKGFTLIELLIVITIVGILASILLARTQGARERANAARTLASLRSAVGTATNCMDEGHDLNVPVVGTPVCIGEDDWPAPIGGGWVYGNFGSCVFDGNVGDNEFMYCAHNGTSVIACTSLTCVKT